MQESLRFGWKRFTLISQIVGEVQGRVLITLLYYTFVVPFGLISRFSGDPLHRRDQPSWLQRAPVPRDLDSAREQG